MLVDLIRGRETEGRETDGRGNARGNKRNVRELLAAAQTHLSDSSQGCSSCYNSPVIQSSTSSPLEAAGCDKGVVCQRPGKAEPDLFNAGKKCRASFKAAWQEAEKIVGFFFR